MKRGYVGVWVGSRKWIVGHSDGSFFEVAADPGMAVLKERAGQGRGLRLGTLRGTLLGVIRKP